MTRRALLASAAVLAGCGAGDDPEPPRASEAPGGDSSLADVALLNDALGLERRSGATEHVRVLEAEIRRARGKVNPLPLPPRRGLDAADVAAEKVAFYVDVLPKVKDPRLRRVLAGLLGGAAEAYADAATDAGEDPAPEAFFAGRTIQP